MYRKAIFILSAVALLLPSCNQEEDAALPTTGTDAAAQPLSVSTRAGADETFDSFRLYLHDLATNTETEEHILAWDGTNGAWLENGRQPVTALLPAIVNATACDAPDQITFENVVQDGELHSCTVTCNIPADQTDADKLEAAGKLMYAFSPRLDKDGSLSLEFQHACSMLVFTVNNKEVIAAGGKGKLANIKVKANTESRYTYDYENESNGGWTPVYQDDNSGFDCFCDETDETNKTITAYIGSKEYKAGDVLMTLNVDGIPRNVPINADLPVEPGKIYTFTLDITPKEITASFKLSDDSNLFGWGSEDEEKEL
ncbi:MAG: fimbrillin family protein [Bacteroidales bacterium]|nr:fimbrillin family protein [Bacteroidales bacterium]